MIDLKYGWLDKEQFKKRIQQGINEILFKGNTSDMLADAIYDEFFSNLYMNQIQYNFEQIKNELEPNYGCNKLSSLESRIFALENILNNLKNTLNQGHN